MELVEQTLRSRQEERLHQKRRHRRPVPPDEFQANRLMEESLVTCGHILVHARQLSSSSSSGSLDGPAPLKCLSEHRLIGATSVYLRAASFARFFGAARELASSCLAQFEDFNAGVGSSVDENALRHCVFLRQRLQVCARGNGMFVEMKRLNSDGSMLTCMPSSGSCKFLTIALGNRKCQIFTIGLSRKGKIMWRLNLGTHSC